MEALGENDGVWVIGRRHCWVMLQRGEPRAPVRLKAGEERAFFEE
jgi:hypothetical protein